MKTGDVSFCEDYWIVATIEEFCFVDKFNSCWISTRISLKIYCRLALLIVTHDRIPLTVTGQKDFQLTKSILIKFI